MAYTWVDYLSGRIKLPEPYASQLMRVGADDSAARTRIINEAIAALNAREAAIETAEAVDEKIRTELAPLARAARKLEAGRSVVPEPPKILATIAAWGSIVALGFGLWRWWKTRKKRAS